MGKFGNWESRWNGTKCAVACIGPGGKFELAFPTANFQLKSDNKFNETSSMFYDKVYYQGPDNKTNINFWDCHPCWKNYASKDSFYKEIIN